MPGFHIGLTGLDVAQRAIDLIGSNIANAATEGYHRQDLRTAPIQLSTEMGGGNGVEIVDVTRAIDLLMERETVAQQPQLGQATQELATLRLVETFLGDLESQGLTLALDKFFTSLQELASQPGSEALQYQAAWAAEGLAQEFRHVGTFLTDLESQLVLEAESAVRDANNLIEQIAELNLQIGNGTYRGGNTNGLRDQRDQAILELGQLVDIQVQNDLGASGEVDVLAWGIPLVVGGHATFLAAAQTGDNALGVTIEGGESYDTDVRGGKLGGLLALRNDLLPALHTDVDTLAAEIIRQVNELHFEGVGTLGSFTDLTGMAVSSQKLSDWSAWGTNISAGTISVRVTDGTTGDAAVYEVNVDGNSTVTTIAQAFDALTGLRAEVSGSALHLYSSDSSRYQFDFIPTATVDTTGSPWTGTSSPTIKGLYSGAANDTLTAEVVATGAPGQTVEVGVTTDLVIEVRDGASQLISTVVVGAGYVAGEALDLGDGITASFDYGTMKIGETFEITAVADPDTSGFMTAVGVNALFSGSDAVTIGVRSDILADARRLAVASDVNGQEHLNANRLAQLARTQVSGLNNATFADDLRRITSSLGQNISFRQARQEALEGALEQLNAERDRVGGVDINQEAAKLLVYQRMYQGCAKFIRTQADMLDYLMNVV